MDTLLEREVLLKAIEVFGWSAQFEIAQEECGELIAAISHYKRCRTIDREKDQLASECADVIIMMHQLRLVLGEDLIDEKIAAKMKRLKGNLGLCL